MTAYFDCECATYIHIRDSIFVFSNKAGGTVDFSLLWMLKGLWLVVDLCGIKLGTSGSGILIVYHGDLVGVRK